MISEKFLILFRGIYHDHGPVLGAGHHVDVGDVVQVEPEMLDRIVGYNRARLQPTDQSPVSPPPYSGICRGQSLA